MKKTIGAIMTAALFLTLPVTVHAQPQTTPQKPQTSCCGTTADPGGSDKGTTVETRTQSRPDARARCCNSMAAMHCGKGRCKRK